MYDKRYYTTANIYKNIKDFLFRRMEKEIFFYTIKYFKGRKKNYSIQRKGMQ